MVSRRNFHKADVIDYEKVISDEGVAEAIMALDDNIRTIIGFLVGQCMKASRGKGNPKLFNELLRTSLS